MSEAKVQNICWDCQKAVGGCSWSRDFTPVEGWDAENVPYQPWETQTVKYRDTYIIRGCPEFLRDEPREISNLMLTHEENVEFMSKGIFKRAYTKSKKQE
jgi:hypothetical protein